jgi:arylsulfatase A-like enzyme
VDRARLLSLYDDEIASVDAQVWTWLYRTRAEGHFANTIFVLFGDHGEEFLEHGKLAHGNGLNEEVLRVPLIICGPGVPKGKRVAAPVSLVDIVPTVYALLGEPVPEGLDGIDLGPLMRGEAGARARAVRIAGSAGLSGLRRAAGQREGHRGFARAALQPLRPRGGSPRAEGPGA